MASVKSPLLRKVERILTKRFPPPSAVKLEDHNGIIGVVTSTKFAKLDGIDRQNLIDDLMATNLSKEERHQVRIIVAVTPDEETGYLAGVD